MMIDVFAILYNIEKCAKIRHSTQLRKTEHIMCVRNIDENFFICNFLMINFFNMNLYLQIKDFVFISALKSPASIDFMIKKSLKSKKSKSYSELQI
jgi:hypothetical protein